MPSNKSDTFFRGLSIQTVVTIIMGILEMVFFSLFSRLLSKSDFGYFAALMGIIAICQSISEAGLGASIIQKKNASEKYISTAFTLSFFIGLLSAILIFLFAPILANLVADSTLTTPLRIMAVTLFLDGLISVGNAQLYRRLNFKRVGIIRCTSYFIAGILGILLAYKGFGLYAIVLYTLLEAVISTTLLYTTSVRIPKFCFERTEINGIISFGGWLTLGVILNNITRQLDKLCTSKLISVEALGKYNRPAGFTTNLTSKITSIFDNVLFPMLSDLQDEKDRVLTLFYRAIALLNSFSAVLSVVFFFNAELIITIFFGSKWLDLVPVMRVVSISVLFNVDGQLVDCFFRSLNYVRTGFILRLIGVFITLVGIVIGSRFGIIGLAVGLVISNVTLILVKVFTLSYKVGADMMEIVKVWTTAWKPVLLLLIIGIVSMCFEASILKYVIVSVLYSIVIFIEFVVFPKMVSNEYLNTVYPKILQCRNKILKKKNGKIFKESM